MIMFSKESILLAKNWDTVEDIFRADKQFRRELIAFLMSIKTELVKHDWWPNGWVLVHYTDEQVYISNKRWLADGVYAVWIGVEGFTPEGLFGSEAPPWLYVWVTQGRVDLARMLAEQIEASEYGVLGEIEHDDESLYVVASMVRKCLPDEVEGFEQVTRRQILDFFVHYAQVLGSLDKVIRDSL
jgi:hypothetical protein